MYPKTPKPPRTSGVVSCCATLFPMNNTLETGTVRCLVYQLPDDSSIYYATALEMNLTVSAENSDIALLELREQVKEYIATALEMKAPELLNQEIDGELEQVWTKTIGTNQEDKEEKQASPMMPVFATASPLASMAV